MARTDWKKKVRNIPAKVQIASKVWYDITWQKEIVDTVGNHLCGFTDLNNKIITIKMDMSPKLTVETFMHECFHAFSEEFELSLTENQVLGMEKMVPYLDGLFNKGKK
jgi:putative protein kinase ArgK-like GTPase of G3E family